MPFSVERSTEIAYRHDFGLLCNARGYLDAVEVGTDLGIFAAKFLDAWQGNWLLMVDPYEPYPERPYDRTLDAVTAIQALARHHGRFRFIRQRSPDAIPAVMGIITAPEFVYIDGSHEREHVAADLAAWWPVIPRNGMLAGHDFDDYHPGVREAVEEFARERGLVVRLTGSEESPASWYIYKSEPGLLCPKYFNDAVSRNPHRVEEDLS